VKAPKDAKEGKAKNGKDPVKAADPKNVTDPKSGKQAK
jgi:hypothetical protein